MSPSCRCGYDVCRCRDVTKPPRTDYNGKPVLPAQEKEPVK